jgi:hypothetical protein
MIHRHIHKALKHTFIPHEGNDYRPHFMREHVVLSIVIVTIFSLIVSITSYIVLRKTSYGTLVIPSVLVDLTNKERLSNNLPPFIKHPLLEYSSQLKGEEMVLYNYFAHESPDGSAPWKFFKRALYPYSYAGENLALNFFTSPQVHTGWMNSPLHRKNILDPNFKEIGISVLTKENVDREDTLFVVQHFGTQKNTAYSNSLVMTYYSSLLERVIFMTPLYIEYLYLFLITLVIIALLALTLIEVEKKHTHHLFYGVLMLVILLLAIMINATLLSYAPHV